MTIFAAPKLANKYHTCKFVWIQVATCKFVPLKYPPEKEVE